MALLNSILGKKEEPRCSFCGRSRMEVKILLSGNKAFICEQCVVASVEVLLKEGVVIWQDLPGTQKQEVDSSENKTTEEKPPDGKS